jgi:hypothetical protein
MRVFAVLTFLDSRDWILLRHFYAKTGFHADTTRFHADTTGRDADSFGYYAQCAEADNWVQS